MKYPLQRSGNGTHFIMPSPKAIDPFLKSGKRIERSLRIADWLKHGIRSPREMMK